MAEKHLRLKYKSNDEHYRTYEIDFDTLKNFIAENTKEKEILKNFDLIEIMYLQSEGNHYTSTGERIKV